MAERFETRNVRNKEIYDSYMGILRISPNEVYGANVDDPTELLNTLHNNEKKEKTNVILSDSDGNILPVSFTPKAFEQIIKDPDTNKDVVSDVIHIVTKIGGDTGDGTVHISNKMVSRSTLLVSKSEKPEESRYSNIRILSGGQPSNSEGKIKGKGWLLYPTESPNDSNYFNDKNKHKLFDKDDSDPRKIQIEKSLKAKNRKWHEQNIPQSERVKVAGKSITILNGINEEIPIYYSRDYVLGQYEGHHIKHIIDEGNNIKNNSLQAWGTGTDGVDEITKLSWLRIDKIIWEALDEIVQGKLRHYKGRYDRLGTEPTIGKGLIEALGFGNTDTWKDKAPILGTETTRGSILYHAMPFHRYWFHRTKQVLRNFIERQKLMNNDTNTENENQDTFTNDEKYLEMKELLGFLNDELITPNPIASRNYAVSLSKNFVICNGKTLSFDNYPNISLQNEKFFNFGDSYTATLTNGKFTQKEFKSGEAFYHLAMSTSGDAQIINVPNLFALYEKSPRFIRGLNWKNPTNDDAIVKIIDKSNVNHEQNYVLTTNATAEEQTGTYNQEIYEGYSITKVLDKCDKPYFHTYDNLIQKEQHQHHLFSSDEGGSGLPKNSKHDDIFIGYQCCESTKGGNNHKRNKAFASWYIGWDRTFSQEYIHQDSVKNGSEKFRFISESGDWKKDDGWIKYCTNKIYNNGFFKTFTPIPNLGFFVFNSSIFNNEGLADVIYDKNNEITEGGLRGNVKYLSGNGFFIDGAGAKHNVVNIFDTSSEETDNKELTEIPADVQNLIDLDKKRQYLKYFAQKWNEAEGFIPISKQGKASGYIHQHWTVRERRGCKGYSRNPYEYTKQNIGGYLLAAPNLVSSDPHDTNVYWRCLTSIPYTNPKKLGVCADFETWGKTKKNYNENSEYYDINSVTQTPDYEKYKRYKFGNFPVEVDETCPTPYHMKFLPLIRI